MTSTTSNKKEIVDFLWEWAESNGDWAKLLVQKVLSSESFLQTNEREEIFKYFLQSIGLINGLPELSLSKPSYSPTGKHVELDSLSEVKGVNRLAKNQTIHFSPNITVIYGENGTGKTGYGRILKTLGFSYDRSNMIYSNIFESSQPKSATITYKADGKAGTFKWNGNNRDDDLESISVFNSDCVKISLDVSRQLIVSPIGFHLFELISSELRALDNLLNSNKGQYSTKLPWIENLHEGSPQHQFMYRLSKESTEEKLHEFSGFNEEHEKVLTTKESELSKLNNSLLQNEIRSLKSQAHELDQIIGKINSAKQILNTERWKQLIDVNTGIISLEKQTKKGIKEIAESKGIEFYESDEFKTFISSAEDYIKLLNKSEYPADGDPCVYCRQPLEADAKELLSNYRTLLNDTTEETITRLKRKKQQFISAVQGLDVSLQLNHASFGLDEDDKPVQPQELKEYNAQLGKLRHTFIMDNVALDSVFELDYDAMITLLSEKKVHLNNELKTKNESLENLDTKEQELKKQIAELKDRKLLSTKTEDIKRAIYNHKILSTLNSQSTAFNTHSISRKTTQAREELVSQDFNQIFQSELKALRKSSLPIELRFGTDRGQTKLNHSIGNHQLLEILSEGEQKAIALAEFLTELQLDNIKAPIIFDDPVNSLDHKIIDEVAKRVIRLSSERQVIAFTHSVLLFNSLLYLSKQSNYKSLYCKFYNIQNEYGEVGIITEAKEEKNKVKENISKINLLINNTPKERPEVDVAKEGYGELRSAIELCVEHEIFHGTVKRYQKNISLTNFIKVDSEKIGTHQETLNDIFERCCAFTGAHSNPEPIYNEPSINDLKTDFEEFKKIRSEFI